jgi:hypothetical protein
MRYLDIDTHDPDFLSDLRGARLNGVTVSRRMQAGIAGSGALWLTVGLSTELGIAVFAHWLYDHVIKKGSPKTSIGGIDIEKNSGQINVIIQNHIYGQDWKPPNDKGEHE